MGRQEQRCDLQRAYVIDQVGEWCTGSIRGLESSKKIRKADVGTTIFKDKANWTRNL